MGAVAGRAWLKKCMATGRALEFSTLREEKSWSPSWRGNQSNREEPVGTRQRHSVSPIPISPIRRLSPHITHPPPHTHTHLFQPIPLPANRQPLAPVMSQCSQILRKPIGGPQGTLKKKRGEGWEGGAGLEGRFKGGQERDKQALGCEGTCRPVMEPHCTKVQQRRKFNSKHSAEEVNF